MEPDNFYVTLPSDGSIETYPANTLTHYKVKLPKALALQESWEVALMEVIYPRLVVNLDYRKQQTQFDIMITDPHLIHDVHGDNNKLGSMQAPKPRYYVAGKNVEPQEFTISDEGSDREGPKRLFHVWIPSGHYYTPTHVVDEINSTINQLFEEVFKEHNIKVRVEYSKIQNRVTVYYNASAKSKIALQLSKGLANILGFSDSNAIHQSPHSARVVADKNVDLDVGLSALYIYTDFIDYHMVGHTAVPLLRTIPFHLGQGSNMSSGEEANIQTHGHWECLQPHYVRVKKSYFDTIEVDIRNDFGLPVPFVKGKTMIKLHFRRTQSAL